MYVCMYVCYRSYAAVFALSSDASFIPSAVYYVLFEWNLLLFQWVNVFSMHDALLSLSGRLVSYCEEIDAEEKDSEGGHR